MAKVRFKKALAAFLSALIVLTTAAYGFTASADNGSQTTLDVSKGSITIGANSVTGRDSQGNEVTATNQNGYRIIGTSGTNTVTVDGCTANITLDNVDIAPTNGCAFKLYNSATVNLTLVGANTLDSRKSDKYAGISVDSGNTVNISGAGSVTVYGGTGNGGAGIGGDENQDGGSVNISGGSVTAYGGGAGAGIGGGFMRNCGTVTISGGIVKAYGGGNGSAGIGGGYCGNGGTVIISGTRTTVSAKGQGGGYDIGSGANSGSSYGVNSGSLTVGTPSDAAIPLPIVSLEADGINSPTSFHNCVVAGKGAESDGIAGIYDASGRRSAPLDVSRGSITMGDGTVTATTSDAEKATPSNCNSYVITGTTTSNTVTVDGCTANITLDNVDIAPTNCHGCAFELDNGATVNLTLVGANTLDTSGSLSYRAGLSVNSGNTVNISGTGSLTAIGGCNSAGIGGNGGYDSGTVNISGGSVSATGGLDGAGIGGGGGGGNTGTVNISGGTVTATGGTYGAGIGGGDAGAGGTINISGGAVTATGGDTGAGIGGGCGAGGGSTTIWGAGTSVNAKGLSGGYDVGSGGSSSNGGSLTVGMANDCPAALPTVTFESAGTNASTSFVNCIIQGSGASTDNIEGTYHAIFYSPDGGANNPASYNSRKGLTLNDLSEPGYTFGGWYSDALCESFSKVTLIAPNANFEFFLYAKLTANTYNINYNLNGGVNNTGNPKTYTYGNSVALGDPTKANYTFGGWYTDSSFSPASKMTSISAAQTGDVTLYAQWTANSYNITYNLDGGANNAGNPKTYICGTAVALSNPTKAGYTFGGWYTDSSFSPASKMTSISAAQTGDVTLYAQWTASTCNITYNLDGGVNNANNPKTYTYGNSVALGDPTKAGCTFGGWYTDSSFSSASKVTSISASQTGDVTLYAQWMPAPPYTQPITTTTPSPVTIIGTVRGDGSETATIPVFDTNTSAVSSVTVNLGSVTFTAPAGVLQAALGNGAGLTLSQGASPNDTQTAVFELVTPSGSVPIASLDMNLNVVPANGAVTAVHNLSGSVTLTITLTKAQEALLDGATPDIYYYDTTKSPATLVDMHAAFDPTTGALSFTTNHFSTYLIAAVPNAAPVVSGITNGGVYNSDITITFDKGTATLDGVPFKSGDTVSAQGKHTFIATDAAGSTTVVFTVNKSAPSVFGVSNNGIYNADKTITFDKGTAILNGIAFTSGTTVSKEGTYTLVVTDAAGNTTTVAFTIDKTAPTVTGVINNAVYGSTRTITFSDGTATLNGIAFASGATVSKEGTYTLAVTDGAGNTTTVAFAIDGSYPVINATAGKNVIASGGYSAANVKVTVQSLFSVTKFAIRNGKIFKWPSDNMFSQGGDYVVFIKDQYGHISKTSFIVDKTAPVITVKKFAGGRTVTVRDANFYSEAATLNGGKITWTKGGRFILRGNYVITATDKAGNKAVKKFSI